MGAILGEPGGGAPILGILKKMKRTLEIGPSLHRGLMRELGWGLFPRDFRRRLKEGSGNVLLLSV